MLNRGVVPQILSKPHLGIPYDYPRYEVCSTRSYGERQERQLKKDMFKSFYREQYVFWR